MKHMSLCEANVALGKEIHEFLVNVPDVNEESITDFLIWRWRSLDKRFKYLSAKTFTRQQEHSVTGADFELELWLVGRSRALPLLFQAKNFVKPFDAYVSKFNYPDNTQNQITTLQNHAAKHSLLPFYAIYSTNSSAAKLLCNGITSKPDVGIFMLPADDAKAFGDAKYGKQLKLDTILEKSNPFYCLFCCPIRSWSKYFKSYFGSKLENYERDSRELPFYVEKLLSSQSPTGSTPFSRTV